MISPFYAVQVWHSVKFLFIGPLIFLMLVVINWMTSPGHWWVQWAGLGLGIAWFCSLLRVLKAAVMLGGIAALLTYLTQRAAGSSQR